MKTARDNSAVVVSVTPEGSAVALLCGIRKQVGVAMLILCAVFNLLDLVTTLLAVTRGFVETYLPSILIMDTVGPLGYAAAKVGFSILLLWNARTVWSSLDRLSAKSGLAVLVMCSVLLVAVASAVFNNLAILQ
jgi:hypothetical protein